KLALSTSHRLVPAIPPLVARSFLTQRVTRLVFVLVRRHEFLISLVRIPETERAVNRRTKGIMQESCLAVVRVAPEELDPAAGRAIGFLEPFFTARLDFVLPERYKHRGPISCSLDFAILQAISRE